MVFLYVSVLASGLLGAFTLVTGGVASGFTPRIHLGLLLLALTAVELALVATRRRHDILRKLALGLGSVVFGLGLLDGVYDHIFKDVLYGHGMPQPLIDTLMAPILGSPGPFWTEAAGWLMAVAGAAGLFSLRALRVKRSGE